MSVPFSQVKPQSLRLKVQPRYPGAYRAGAGIRVDQVSGVVTTSVDFSNLVRDDIATVTGLYVGAWDTTAKIFKLVKGDSLKGAKGDVGDYGLFGSVAAAAAATLSANLNYIYVTGYYNAIDIGGGLWRKLSAPPAQVKKWHFQNVGGAYFQLVPLPDGFVTPQMLGAKGDNSQLEAAYIQAAVDFTSGRVKFPNGDYPIEAEILVPYYGAQLIAESNQGPGGRGAALLPQPGVKQTMMIGTSAAGAGPAIVKGLRFERISTGRWLQATKTINGITTATTAVVTIPAHGYANGDLFYITNGGNFSSLTGKIVKVASAVTNSFSIVDPNTSVGIDTSALGVYTTNSGSGQKNTQSFNWNTTVGNIDTGAGGVAGYQLRIWYHTGVIENCVFIQGYAGIWLDAPSYPLISNNHFAGYWNSLIPGLQDRFADIYVPASGLATGINIENNMMEGTDIFCDPGTSAKTAIQNITRGNSPAAPSPANREDIGSKYAIYCESGEIINICNKNVIGGHNEAGIGLSNVGGAGVFIGHVKIVNNFLDGDRGSSIHVYNSAGGTIANFLMQGNTCNGGDVCDRALDIDARSDGSPSVSLLNISGNTGQGYRMSPFAIRSVNGGVIEGNVFGAYNRLGDTSGQTDVTSMVWVDTLTRGLLVANNVGGGGVNNPVGANGCKWVVVFNDAVNNGWVSGNRANNLGLAGGGVANVTQTYPA